MTSEEKCAKILMIWNYFIISSFTETDNIFRQKHFHIKRAINWKQQDVLSLLVVSLN